LQDPNRTTSNGARPSNLADPEGNWTDNASNTITRSGFGLWNNYDDRKAGLFPGPDSARLGMYTPIDLLKSKSGAAVTTPAQWFTQQRPAILKDVQEEVWGVVPSAAVLPSVSFATTTTSGSTAAGAYKQKNIIGTIDISRYPQVRNRPQIRAFLRTPANATGKVPVMVIFSPFPGFGSFFLDTYWGYVAPKGWGVCIFENGDVQPDNGAGLTSYLIGLVNQGNWRKPTDWGTLAAWGWGVSRLIDYFETDTDVDATKIGLSGHSRFGKATLVTMAYEPRLAIAYPSCAGSLGTSMERRHWGQDIENSGWDQEYHWVAGNFFKWHGPLIPGQYLPRKVELMPVDAHSLLSLCAPRPVFSNAGLGDTWTDPYGIYLTSAGATPVYKLLGYEGIVMNDAKPVLDKAYISGQLGYRYHKEGHVDGPDWPAFIEFASRYFNNAKPLVTAGQSFSIDGGSCNVVGTATGTDTDANTTLRAWQITGGDGAALFAIDGATGQLSIPNPALLDYSRSSYSLKVTVSDGLGTSAEQAVTVSIPRKVSVCHKGKNVLSIGKESVQDHLAHGDCLGSCGTAARGTASQASITNYGMEVYPNPVQENLTVALHGNELHIRQIELVDVVGKVVLQINISGNNDVVIPRSQLKPGVYTLRAHGDKVLSQRVLVE
jgi:hypothetical protein